MSTSSPRHPFRMLFAAHAPYVARCARNYGVRDADVPDVVQQVFVALHHAIRRGLDLSRPLSSWLCAVTYRTARDHRRRAMNEQEVLSVTGSIETADETPDPEATMQAIDVHRMTYMVLDELPPHLRVVLAMSDIDDLPMSEVAAVLEIPLGTAYTRLRAARRAFEEAWNQQRATGHRAALPFMLWDASDLLHAARATPNLAPEITDAIWRGLVDAIGPSIVVGAAAGLAAATSGSPAAGAAKALAARKVAGVVVTMVAAVGLFAALRPAADRSHDPEPSPAAHASHDIGPATSDAMTAAVTPVDQCSTPAASTATPSIAPVARAASRRPNPTARAVTKASAVTATNVSERTWLQAGRDALDRGDVAAARAALAHVESARFARERDELLRLAGGP